MRLLLAGLAGISVLAMAACGADAQTGPNGASFLAQNALQPGVKTTASGLQYKIIKSGPVGGVRPTLADQVTVHYEAALLDGKVVDSSFARGEPSEFPLRGLVAAWEEALPMMVPGDEWTLWSPPKLAYGDKGAGNDIPPNSVLRFRIQLVKVN